MSTTTAPTPEPDTELTIGDQVLVHYEHYSRQGRLSTFSGKVVATGDLLTTIELGTANAPRYQGDLRQVFVHPETGGVVVWSLGEDRLTRLTTHPRDILGHVERV